MSINSVTTMGLSPLSYALASALLASGMSIAFIMPAFGLTMAAVVAWMAAASTGIRMTD